MAHAHMMTRMTRMTRWLDSHDSLACWLAVCQDPLDCMPLATLVITSAYYINVNSLHDEESK